VARVFCVSSKTDEQHNHNRLHYRSEFHFPSNCRSAASPATSISLSFLHRQINARLKLVCNQIGVHAKLAVFQIGRQHNEPIFHVVSDGRYPEPTFKLIVPLKSGIPLACLIGKPTPDSLVDNQIGVRPKLVAIELG
jgi:hypothetical protein